MLSVVCVASGLGSSARHMRGPHLGEIVRLILAEALRDLEDGLDGVRRDEVLRGLNAHHRTVLDLGHRRLPACVSVLERGYEAAARGVGGEEEQPEWCEGLRIGVGAIGG